LAAREADSDATETELDEWAADLDTAAVETDVRDRR
jgi:hypothetical protein